MIEALRPSTLGEILDRTANIYRARFLVFLGIAFMPTSVILACAAIMLLFFAWVGTHGDAASPLAVGLASVLLLGAGLVIFLPICIAAAGLGAGALNHAAAAAFENQEITIRGSYRAAWKRGWHYIWLLVLEGLVLVVAPGLVWTIMIVVFAIGQMMAGKTSPQVGVGAGIVAFLFLVGLYALWMLLMLCLSFPACVVENVGAATAVKRAIALSKGTRGRILVLYILGMVLRWGISFVLLLPLILIISFVPGLDSPRHAQVIGSLMIVLIYGGVFLVRAVTKPIYTIAQMLLYYDQRIRKEGFDIDWLMRRAGLVQPPAAAPEAAPWMPPVSARAGAPLLRAEPTEFNAASSQDAAGSHRPSGIAAESPTPSPTAPPGSLPPDALQPVGGEPA